MQNILLKMDDEKIKKICRALQIKHAKGDFLPEKNMVDELGMEFLKAVYIGLGREAMGLSPSVVVDDAPKMKDPSCSVYNSTFRPKLKIPKGVMLHYAQEKEKSSQHVGANTAK